jgi:hypothetical protein
MRASNDMHAHAVVQESAGAASAEQAAAWEEERKVSRYAENLPQLEAGLGKWGRETPSDPSKWSCDKTGVKENLWLNLSTGFIGSGRQASHCCLPFSGLQSHSSCQSPLEFHVQMCFALSQGHACQMLLGEKRILQYLPFIQDTTEPSTSGFSAPL